jgi:hypothetical protein
MDRHLSKAIQPNESSMSSSVTFNDFQSARVLPGIVASQRLTADLVNVV